MFVQLISLRIKLANDFASDAKEPDCIIQIRSDLSKADWLGTYLRLLCTVHVFDDLEAGLKKKQK